MSNHAERDGHETSECAQLQQQLFHIERLLAAKEDEVRRLSESLRIADAAVVAALSEFANREAANAQQAAEIGELNDAYKRTRLALAAKHEEAKQQAAEIAELRGKCSTIETVEAYHETLTAVRQDKYEQLYRSLDQQQEDLATLTNENERLAAALKAVTTICEERSKLTGGEGVMSMAEFHFARKILAKIAELRK